MNEDESAFSGDRSRFEGATIWLHEASHAAHYLTRWPEKILEVRIEKAELGYLKAEPVLVHGVEFEDLGCGMRRQSLGTSHYPPRRKHQTRRRVHEFHERCHLNCRYKTFYHFEIWDCSSPSLRD